MMLYDRREDFDVRYDLAAEPWGHPNTRREVRLHYDPAVLRRHHIERAQRIAADLRLIGVVVVVGAGFGWGVEGFRASGLEAVGIDRSLWIQQVKACDCRADVEAAVAAAGGSPADVARIMAGCPARMASVPILDEDLTTEESRARVIKAAGGTVSWVVSEDVLTDLSEEEALALSRDMHALGGRVAHVVSVADRLAGWRALLPADRVVLA